MNQIAHHLRRRLPSSVKRFGGALLDSVDPLVVASLVARGEIDGPVPPRPLRARIGEPGARAFSRSGRHVADEVETILREAGYPLHRARSVWDLGGGSGRVLTNLALSSSASRASSDIDAEACSWLVAAHGVDARVTTAVPPTSFPADGFDLVLAISLFTHLDENHQDLWLAEVARVLKPDGLALLTTMGPGLLQAYRSGRRPGMETAAERLADGELTEHGMIFAPERGTSSYGLTFHDRDYVRERWSKVLSVDRIVEEAVNWRQDAVLCSRYS